MASKTKRANPSRSRVKVSAGALDPAEVETLDRWFRAAKLTASARECKCSFRYRCLRWLRTVEAEMDVRCAISSLLSPRPTSRSTRNTWDVRFATGSGGM